MNLVLQDIARVKYADIDIDGITVITGFNGTGKSTISKSLYSMLYAQNELDKKISLERRSDMQRIIRQWTMKYIKIGDNLTTHALTLWNRIYGRIVNNIENSDNFTLAKLEKIIYSQNDNAIDIDKDAVKQLYDRLFSEINTSPDKYIPVIFQKEFNRHFHNQINTIWENTEGKIFLNIDDKNNQISFYNNIIDNIKIHFSYVNPIYIMSRNLLDNILFKGSISRLRLGNTFIEDRLNKLIINKNDFSAQEFYDRIRRTKQINQILDKIVKGQIDVNNTNGYISYKENNDTPSIDFVNLASGIKPFIILKTLLGNGGLKEHGILIYDEPEVNMHPEWQVKFAELLVLLYVEFDIHLLINSHSPYFVRAIEFFSDKYKVVNKTNYYFMELGDLNMSYSKNIKDNLDYMYSTMQKPFEEILY